MTDPIRQRDLKKEKHFGWCQKCKEEKPWNRITFEEHCDDCGTEIIWLPVGKSLDELLSSERKRVLESDEVKGLKEACDTFNFKILHKYIRVIGETSNRVEFDEDEFIEAREEWLESLAAFAKFKEQKGDPNE